MKKTATVLTAVLITAAAFGAAAEEGFTQTGYASWYGGKFQGRKTASGEIFDTHKLTAAHKRLPFGTLVEVTNLSNGKEVVVRINDRGPFVEGRIIDLSRAAAIEIGMLGSGVTKVKIQILGKKEGGKENGDKEEGEKGKALPIPSVPGDNGGNYPDPRDNPIYSFPEPESYTIQIASFSERENARRLFVSLEAEELEPSYQESGNGHYRVVIDGILPEELEGVRKRLSDLGHKNILVRENL